MIYRDKNIGQIEFLARNNQKKIKLQYHPIRGVICSFPSSISHKEALKFVNRNTDWILSQQKLVREDFFEKNKSIKLVYNDIFFEYNCKVFNIEYNELLKKIIIKVPVFDPIKNLATLNQLTDIVHNIIKREALIFLPERCNFLSKNYSLPFNRLTIKLIISRWGSCSYKNNINLNAHLVRLPSELIDYVILHELTHTLHKNHQKPFWDYLNNLLEGKAKKLDKKLNAYHINIFA